MVDRTSAAAPASPHQSPVDQPKFNPIMCVLILGTVTAFASLSVDMYLPAFPQIARGFGVDIGAVQLTLSVFLIGMAVGQILHGPLSDRYGRRVELQIGASIFLISALGCAWATSVQSLIVWRALMAVGGSAGMVVARAVVRDLFDQVASARYFSLLMLVTGAAPIIAPLLGGQILRVAGWRSIFGVLATVGVIGLVAVSWKLPESLPPSRRATGGFGDVLRVYARLLRNRAFISSALALGFAYSAMFAYITGSSAVFILAYGVSPQKFGLFFGSNALGMITLSMLNRRLVLRYPPRRIVTFAYTSFVLAGVLLALIGVAGRGGLWLFASVLFVCISLLGLLLPNLAAMALAPFRNEAGSASAVLGMMQFTIGGLASTAVSLIPSLIHGRAAVPTTMIVAICACAGWIALRLGHSKGRVEVQEATVASFK